MTLQTFGARLRHASGTSLAVLGIIVASAVGLHEWADAEAVRALPTTTDASSTADPGESVS
jgi:hypothetical protein